MLAIAGAVLASALAGPATAATPDLSAYLRARAAAADGAVALSAHDYAAALAGAPDDPVVAVRAYRQALAAGDDALADRAAAVLEAADVAPGDVPLLAIGSAAHRRDPAAADAAIARLAKGPIGVLAPALRGWLALERGGDPFAPLAAAGGDAIARRFADEQRALLLIATGRATEGVAALGALLGGDRSSGDLRVAAARLLAGQGRGDLGRTLLAGDDPVLGAWRVRLGDGVRPSFAFGAAQLFDRLAADLSGGDPSPLSVTLASAALRARPDDDRARLLLADALARIGSPARALAVLGEIGEDSAYAGVARSARVSVVEETGDPAATLAAAQALAARADATPYDRQRYGDALLAAGRADAAAAVYARVIADGTDDWSAWLQYGGALDQAGRWPAARKALAKAAALGPDEPMALNYLGYAQIEHDEAADASRRMLERAAALKPGDAAIADSLGWAYWRHGDRARALPLLERAARGAPANATIAEHLGDAYWALGRRFEARYAWRRGVEVAEPDAATRLEGKIAHGLVAGR